MYLMDQDDMQDVKYIIKTHEAVADNLRIKKYINQIENRITFRIKARY